MQRAIRLYVRTIGEQFIGAVFTGDTSGLTADEEHRFEYEHHEDIIAGQDAYGDDLLAIEYFSKTSDRYWARCEISNTFGMCVEVEVFAFVEIHNPEEHPSDAHFGINSNL